MLGGDGKFVALSVILASERSIKSDTSRRSTAVDSQRLLDQLE